MEHQKKNKKVMFDTNQKHSSANSTLDIHQELKFHPLPNIKKYQSSENTYLKNIAIEDEDLYKMFQHFLSRLISDKQYCQQIIEEVDFQQLKPQHSQPSQNVTKTHAIKQQEKSDSRRFSKKSQGSSENWVNSKRSENQSKKLQLPQLQITINLIKQIFIVPSLFLMNLSVCLVLKYCALSKTPLQRSNSGWLLCIASIVAYKIYYDQQFEDLLQSFEDVINLRKNQIIYLERIFLEGLDYRVIISGTQYQYVVARMLQNNKQNRGVNA